MIRRSIYTELNLDKHFQGDVFELAITNENTSTEQNRLNLLDRVCKTENLNPLGEDWDLIDFALASDLLLKSLRYDLAYSNLEISTQQQSILFQQEIIKGFDAENCYCYTNWSGDLWNNEGGVGWDPLTSHTFDMGIVFIGQHKLTFALHISED
jgi:hypothetical protein